MADPKKILIIDDDPDFVAAVSAVLKGAGYTVESAPNGKEGLELAKRFEPDLVLLDVMMTERTEGFFTLQEFRRTPGLETTPVIVVSSIYAEYPFFKVEPDSDWLPANSFIPKPIEPQKLLEEVKKAIDNAGKES